MLFDKVFEFVDDNDLFVEANGGDIVGEVLVCFGGFVVDGIPICLGKFDAKAAVFVFQWWVPFRGFGWFGAVLIVFLRVIFYCFCIDFSFYFLIFGCILLDIIDCNVAFCSCKNR